MIDALPGSIPNPQTAVRRVVLLGASNLTRGISTVVETAQHAWGPSLDLLAALGYGRSYGLITTVLGRRLPPILDCGLWQHLDHSPRVPTAALVTDVGNDLMYGVEVDQIVRWVECAVDRLQRQGASVAMTLLPIDSVNRLSPLRFRLFRGLLFPSCRLPFDRLQGMVVELHQRLEELGRTRGVRVVEHRADWYGLDPIHIRRAYWPHAWREMLHEGGADRLPDLAHGSLRRWAYLRTRLPARVELFGVERQAAQPAARLPDGTTVSFY